MLNPCGSFFLNVGAAPSNPMLPHEIVMTLREFFVLQNTIHWIKSIAIEDCCSRRPVGDAGASHPPSRSFGAASREAAESHSIARPFQANQLKTVSQRLPRIHF